MTDAFKFPSDYRGKLLREVSMAPYTWFRVGGCADALFLPADEADLANFLKQVSADIPITILGVGSNTIVREGGIAGITIRLMGKAWGSVTCENGTVTAAAGALDLSVAKAAARAGYSGLSFLSGIPGSVGGALRTNAGCYGQELSNVLLRVEGITRAGDPFSMEREAIHFTYRHTDFPEDLIATRLTLQAQPGADPEALRAEIAAHQARRAETQPIKDKTGGSTFANPDPPGTQNQRSAWKLIDAAGCRGLRVGGAQVSEKHCNFLINTGTASAADIEALGELVRAQVLAHSGVDLRWEIRRIGRLQAGTSYA